MACAQSTIETAALGRPFQLGMLYDCRRDAIIPGITLWDQEQLTQNKDVRSHINTEFTVTTLDTIEEKSKQLKVDGELKLSLLGGMITLSGAARYFNNTKKSFLQQRLTLHYRTSTKFEQLTMNHLAPRKMEHLDVFDHDVATHVVTAVQYGANAYFVFDREVNSSEETKNVKGEVKLACEMLKKLGSVGAQAEINMSESEKATVKQLNCTFYGDFMLPSNPSTFEDAVKVYTDLPKMLGENGEHAVPVKVWLYPLDKLDSRAAKLQRNITTELMRAVESVIETLNDTEMKCGDLLQDTAATSFSKFHDPVQNFQKFCSAYKREFMAELGSLLPKIRGGEKDISALNELLKAHDESPFIRRDLQKWITLKEEKSNQVKALLKQLNDLGAEVDENAEKYLLDTNVKLVVSYVFPCIQHSDLLLTKQKNYLYPSDADMKSTHDQDFQETSWTTGYRMCMKNSVKFFKDLINSNKSQSTKFIVQAKPQTSECLSSCILVYDDDDDEGSRFVPPAKPTCPNIEAVTDNSITVKLSAPCAATVKRKLLYKMKQESDWKSRPVDQDTVTLENLKDGTDYEIKCGAVGKLDYMVESDLTTCSVLKSQKSTQQVVGGPNACSPYMLSHSHQKQEGGKLYQPHQMKSENDRSPYSLTGKRNSPGNQETTNPPLSKLKAVAVKSTVKYSTLLAGQTLNTDEDFKAQLKHEIPELEEVFTVDECDLILVFCPVGSQVGFDIKAALKKLNHHSADKPAVLVVLHRTFDRECVVPDSSRAVHRERTITVDCLFIEEQGLLQCKNQESFNRVINYIKLQIYTEERMETDPSCMPSRGSSSQCSDKHENMITGAASSENKLTSMEIKLQDKDKQLEVMRKELEKLNTDLAEKNKQLEHYMSLITRIESLLAEKPNAV